MKHFFYVVCTLVLFSCESNETPIDANNLLLGHWSNPVYNNEETTFSRVASLPEESYGVSFLENGDFIERTSGFCGTPPLTFFNNQGRFELEDTLIKIIHSYHSNYFTWRIVTLTETSLTIKRELTPQEIDHQKLMVLYDEISALAYSVSCVDASNWQFTPYGAKACGGPQGYLPYSNKIDTVIFLKKVDEYTEAEKEYNIKWGIISDCSVPSEPISIDCKNGFPYLNF